MKTTKMNSYRAVSLMGVLASIATPAFALTPLTPNKPVLTASPSSASATTPTAKKQATIHKSAVVSPLQGYLNTRHGFDPHILTKEEASQSMVKGITPEDQIMTRRKGVATPHELIKQSGVAREGTKNDPIQLFPAQPLGFMPYLDGVYVFGNTCTQPGAWIDEDMLSTGAQKIKKSLSKIGVSYFLQHGFSYTNVARGLPDNRDARRDFSTYNTTLLANITLIRNSRTGDGLFLATEFDYGHGFGFNENMTTPSGSIGALQNTTGYYQGNTAHLANVSLGYSAFKGKLMVMAGQIDSTNYLDHNAYAWGHSNQLNNNSFVDNPVIPFTFATWGYHIAYQPTKSFYMMLTSASNNGLVNHNPFNYISSNNWTNIMEFGWITQDLGGWGPGIYRLQPFYTTSQGEDGFGFATNMQQQLGKGSTMGWFFRGGWADDNASALTGVKASVATGFAWEAPFSSKGLLRFANDGYLGLGFVWIQASNKTGPHENDHEYGVELTYTMQVTPTMTLQPDLQITHNPINGKSGQTNVVLQIQNVWTW